MNKLSTLQPQKVFKRFEEICSIPHGSGNTDKITSYCMDFASSLGLYAERDSKNNVIIKKDASKGYENSKPVILQGHLDMVCQKTAESQIDFENDGLDIYIDGDFVKAHGTTLGADNGIAVAMIMAILESNDIQHPPIEAVFTTDEEIGMLGAAELDMSKLAARRMLNLDSECIDVLTVSCAGGAKVDILLPIERHVKTGAKVVLTIKGLHGGHSGVEIDKGRVNSNILMGRILFHMEKEQGFDIINVCGGDKDNVITSSTKAELLVTDADSFTGTLNKYLDIVKKEMYSREPSLDFDIAVTGKYTESVLCPKDAKKLIRMLTCTPSGVMKMSADINGLVETSLNLGVINTTENTFNMCYALRSNKQTALYALEEKMHSFASVFEADCHSSGHYPPWEFVNDSEMQKMYIETFEEMFGKKPSVEAIHAGLECGMFSAGLEGLDCVSFGPVAIDIHSVNERLSITSTKETFELVLKLLEKMK